MAHLADYIPSLLTLCVIGVGLAFFHWVLIRRNTHLTSDQRLPRQLIMLLLTFVSVIAFVLSLPLSEAIQNQMRFTTRHHANHKIATKITGIS